jgi:6-phosphogluconolactonase
MAPHEPPAIALAPGAGPRHLAFHPGGRFVYVINELLNTITAFGYDARTGSADEIQTIGTLPEGFTGQNTTAEIAVHPSGRFLYGSNRGHDSLVVYVIDPDNGRLDLAGHVHTQGRAPRNFAIDPSGHWILAANQNSDNVVVLSVDSTTGMPHATGRSVEVPAPVCILFR